MDKVYHAAAGFIIFALTFAVCRWAGIGFEEVAAYTATLLIGVLKEVWDHYHPPHVADTWDVVATVLGGVLAHGIAVALMVTTVCRIMGAC